MKRRSRGDGEPIKARRRKAKALKRRNRPKTVRRRNSFGVGRETEVARLTRERDEALEQQTATSEILSVISRSNFKLQPVLQSVVNTAMRLCRAEQAVIYRQEEGTYRFVAGHSTVPDYLDIEKETVILPGKGTVVGRAALTEQVARIDDAWNDQLYKKKRDAKIGGVRSMIGVPLLREGKTIGVIALARNRVEPFTDREIELVATFADQVVIAIENVRLFEAEQQRSHELSESLQQQTASSEVLQVISSSPGELQAVFDVILDKVVQICQADTATLFLYEKGTVRRAARHSGVSDAIMPIVPSAKSGTMRSIATKQIIHIPDYLADPAYLEGDGFIVAAAERLGIRASLHVPMLREQEAVGAVTIWRKEARAFTKKQIDLVANFAAQAVIAIENARLLNELRQRTTDLTEALEQQTATSEVLQVISSSSGNLQPVFTTILENAARICDANFGNVYLWDGDAFHLVAAHNTPHAFADTRRRTPFRPNSGHPFRSLAETKQVFHVADIMTLPIYLEGDPQIVEAVELGKMRTCLGVPMLKDNNLIGAVLVFRQEVRLFTANQIALITNFAGQAVIAIENGRLLNELREALEQQTATSEVLSVISSSTGDLEAVFRTMLENATRICEAKFGTLDLHEGGGLRLAAAHDVPPEFTTIRGEGSFQPAPGGILDMAMKTRRTVHIHDLATTDAYAQRHPKMVDAVEVAGIRTAVGVPMLKDEELVGIIAIFRQEVRPFTDKQIELFTNFANQAVIAIENARLLNELRQRTADLTQSLEDLRGAQDRLVQTEKLASLGQLTAGIAHEIKNPLNFVNNFSAVSIELIDELREALGGVHLDTKLRADISEIADTLQGNLGKVVQHGKRADAIVKNMLLHSRQGSGEHRPVDINALVDESLNLAYHGARAEKQGFNITLERSFDPTVGEVDLFPQEITRVLLNLISNGFYAATKRKAEVNRGDYEPTLAVATKSLGDKVEIRIRDNGTGIPPEVKEKLFNPFFTTKPAGEGTGLGLSISHDIIVKQHSGSIEVDTRLGEFTEFRIVLPRAAVSANKPGGGGA